MPGEEVDINDWLIEAAGEEEIERARDFHNFKKESFFNCSEHLHLAAEGGFFKMCKFLIEKRAVDVNKLNSRGVTPLYVTCASYLNYPIEAETIVELLLNNGANISIPNPDDREKKTPLHCVAAKGKVSLVEILLGAGADVDIRTEDGSTPLYYACALANETIVEILCRNNANVNARDERGWSALHAAAFYVCDDEEAEAEAVPVIETLLKFGLNVDVQGSHMQTALHCLCPDVERIAIALLDNGCDINVETSNGKTALDVVITRAKHDSRMSELDMFENVSGMYNGDDASADDNFEPNKFLAVVTLKQHLIKLKTAKLFVSQKNLSQLNINDFPDFEKRCQEEINATRNVELHPGTTLYSILSAGVNPTYAKNKPVMEVLQYFNWDPFPLYKNIILNNLKKSKCRHDLLESGEKWLGILLKTSSVLNKFSVPTVIMSAEILSMIVSFLTNDELKTLITCGEELQHQLAHRSSDRGSSAS